MEKNRELILIAREKERKLRRMQNVWKQIN